MRNRIGFDSSLCWEDPHLLRGIMSSMRRWPFSITEPSTDNKLPEMVLLGFSKIGYHLASATVMPADPGDLELTPTRSLDLKFIGNEEISELARGCNTSSTHPPYDFPADKCQALRANFAVRVGPVRRYSDLTVVELPEAYEFRRIDRRELSKPANLGELRERNWRGLNFYELVSRGD